MNKDAVAGNPLKEGWNYNKIGIAAVVGAIPIVSLVVSVGGAYA